MGAALTTRAMGVVLIALALSTSSSAQHLLLLGVGRGSSAPGVSFIESAYSGATANDNTITLTSVQAGDLVAVIAGITNTANTLTVSDNAGHTWVADCPSGTLTNTGLASVGVQVRYAVATGAITTITLTSSVSASTYGAAIVYRGLGAVTCDGNGSADGDATTSHGVGISVSPSTTNPTLMVGGLACATNCTVSGAAPDYTQVSGTPPGRFVAAYKLVTSTSARAFANTTSSGVDSVSVLSALKAP